MVARKAASRKSSRRTKAAGKKRKVTKKKTSARKKPIARKKTVAKKSSKKPTKKKASKKKPVTRKKASKKKVAKKAASKKKATRKKPSKKKAAKKAASKKKVARKAPSKKKAAKKAASKKKVARKAPSKKKAAKKVSKKRVSKKKVSAKATPKKKAPARVAKSRAKRGDVLSGPIHGIESYIVKRGEEYMSEGQLKHFNGILNSWKNELMGEVDRTVHHMQDEAASFPDPNDRATQESEFGLELRTRDRERKLIRKISSALTRIEDGSYGYCDETGEEIGLKRLEARPVATLTVEAQERREMAERQFRDRDDRYR